MEKSESLSHVRWECKYHVVFIPKYRRKVMHGRTKPGTSLANAPLCGASQSHGLRPWSITELPVPPSDVNPAAG